jgi:hypothetical protein
MWFTILFGLFLLAFSAIMLVRNRAAWRAAQAADMEEREREFLNRQYRRRRQAAASISIVGLAIMLSVWVTDTKTAAVYWLGVLLIVCWITLLAVADLIATRMHYGRLLQDQQNERTALEAELNQIKRRESNGKPKPKPPAEDLQ